VVGFKGKAMALSLERLGFWGDSNKSKAYL